MKKQIVFILILLLVTGMISGCATEAQQFDDKNIQFNLVDSEADGDYRSYTIEVINNTGRDLKNLVFNLSYPLKTENADPQTKTVNSVREFTIDAGKSRQLFFPSSLVVNPEVFDFNDPHIELKGNVVHGNNLTPFHIVGSLQALEGTS